MFWDGFKLFYHVKHSLSGNGSCLDCVECFSPIAVWLLGKCEGIKKTFE